MISRQMDEIFQFICFFCEIVTNNDYLSSLTPSLLNSIKK